MRIHIINGDGQLLESTPDASPESWATAWKEPDGKWKPETFAMELERVHIQSDVLTRMIQIREAYEKSKRKTKAVDRLMTEVSNLCCSYWITTPYIQENYERAADFDGFVQIQFDRLLCGWETRHKGERQQERTEMELLTDPGVYTRVASYLIDACRRERIPRDAMLPVVAHLAANESIRFITGRLPTFEEHRDRDKHIVHEIEAAVDMVSTVMRKLVSNQFGIEYREIEDDDDEEGDDKDTTFLQNISGGVVNIPNDDPHHEQIRQEILAVFKRQNADQVARGHTLGALIVSEVLLRAVVDHFPNGGPSKDVIKYMRAIVDGFTHSMRADVLENMGSLFDTGKPPATTLH